MSAGLASFAASFLVTQAPGTAMSGYGTVDAVAAVFSILTLFIARRVRRPVSV